jgi:hypothetical protein
MHKCLLIFAFMLMLMSSWSAHAQTGCTPPTLALNLTALEDGQPAGSITPQIIRNLACSTAILSNPQTFTAAQRGQPSTLTISTSTFTPSFDAAQNFSITLVHASCPCTIANPSTTPTAGQSGMMTVIQSTTGSDTIGTWGSDYKFSGATAPTLSTGASAVDLLPYYVVSSTQIVVGAGALNAH